MRIVPLIKFCTNQALQLRPAIGVLSLSPTPTLRLNIVPRELTGYGRFSSAVGNFVEAARLLSPLLQFPDHLHV
jgi:hypothetical protein